jgi:hypothetical protein
MALPFLQVRWPTTLWKPGAHPTSSSAGNLPPPRQTGQQECFTAVLLSTVEETQFTLVP